MSATTIVRAQVDADLKAQAKAVLGEMGLTVSEAVEMLLRRVARDKKLPFEARRPNAETIAAMEEARAGGLPSFATVEELMADLNAED